MTKDEALKMALEALECVTGHFTRTPSTLRDSEVRGEAHKAITAIKEALAQQQEPAAWRYNGKLHEFDPSDWATGPVTPLYTSPPAKPWVGLTDEDKEELDEKYGDDALAHLNAVEAKLRSKNT